MCYASGYLRFECNKKNRQSIDCMTKNNLKHAAQSAMILFTYPLIKSENDAIEFLRNVIWNVQRNDNEWVYTQHGADRTSTFHMQSVVFLQDGYDSRHIGDVNDKWMRSITCQLTLLNFAQELFWNINWNQN